MFFWLGFRLAGAHALLPVRHSCTSKHDEAPVLGAFQEAPGMPEVQSVGHRHHGRGKIDDQVPGDASEEDLARFQARGNRRHPGSTIPA